jgi:hypothetical protein
MKVSDLKRNDLFKFSNQRKFRKFRQSEILNGDLIPKEHKGKTLIIYDNCKQMIADKNDEVEILSTFPIRQMGNSYSTSTTYLPVIINGFETLISNLLKDNEKMIFVYSIKTKNGDFTMLDVREIPDFETLDFRELMEHGVNKLQNFINKNPNGFLHYAE